jgi:4-hydroxy-2-oxoheptanedioate aldolase
VGSWCNFASFASVEMMASLGFDFVVMDMQHGEITQSHFPALFGAFGRTKTIPVVRAPKNDYHAINWLFDQGAPVVLVPLVNSVAEARRAIEAAKFPPLGKRSFGPFRASGYGLTLSPYMTKADANATIIFQVEDARAARQIDEILALPGVDAIFLGPNDIAYSLLGPGESIDFSGPVGWSTFSRTPEVLELCEHVRQRCAAAKIPFGTTAASNDELRDWLERGSQFATFGSDFHFMRTGAQTLTGVRPQEKK